MTCKRLLVHSNAALCRKFLQCISKFYLLSSFFQLTENPCTIQKVVLLIHVHAPTDRYQLAGMQTCMHSRLSRSIKYIY